MAKSLSCEYTKFLSNLGTILNYDYYEFKNLLNYDYYEFKNLLGIYNRFKIFLRSWNLIKPR